MGAASALCCGSCPCCCKGCWKTGATASSSRTKGRLSSGPLAACPASRCTGLLSPVRHQSGIFQQLLVAWSEATVRDCSAGESTHSGCLHCQLQQWLSLPVLKLVMYSSHIFEPCIQIHGSLVMQDALFRSVNTKIQVFCISDNQGKPHKGLGSAARCPNFVLCVEVKHGSVCCTVMPNPDGTPSDGTQHGA